MPSSWASALLGPTLLVTPPGGGPPVSTPTDAHLSGKARVLLYMSASWCPPCKVFTPQLATMYEDADGDEGDTAIVYISSDFDAASFSEYFKKMPWAALPWSPAASSALGTTFGVSGIPALIALDGVDGALLTTGARGLVTAARSLAPLASLPKGELPVRGRALESLPSVWGGLLGAITCGMCARPARGGAGRK